MSTNGIFAQSEDKDNKLYKINIIFSGVPFQFHNFVI